MPEARAESEPVDPIVAVVVLLLLQDPVNGVAPKKVLTPAHILPLPEIALGCMFTVTTAVVRHPVGRV